MKTICLLGLMSLFLQEAIAQSDSLPSPAKHLYKLNRDEFMLRYGNDDSSRMLIKLFYYKRKLIVPQYFIMGAGMVASAMLIRSNIDDQVIALISAGLVYNGAIHMRWSRENLYLILQEYKIGKDFPPFYKRKLKRYMRRHQNA